MRGGVDVRWMERSRPLVLGGDRKELNVARQMLPEGIWITFGRWGVWGDLHPLFFCHFSSRHRIVSGEESFPMRRPPEEPLWVP